MFHVKQEKIKKMKNNKQDKILIPLAIILAIILCIIISLFTIKVTEKLTNTTRKPVPEVTTKTEVPEPKLNIENNSSMLQYKQMMGCGGVPDTSTLKEINITGFKNIPGGEAKYNTVKEATGFKIDVAADTVNPFTYENLVGAFKSTGIITVDVGKNIKSVSVDRVGHKQPTSQGLSPIMDTAKPSANNDVLIADKIDPDNLISCSSGLVWTEGNTVKIEMDNLNYVSLYVETEG